MQEKEPQYVNSIIRATSILELYEKLNVQYLGIAEISKELGIQKTTVFNIVKTLAHQGWLIRSEDHNLHGIPHTFCILYGYAGKCSICAARR